MVRLAFVMELNLGNEKIYKEKHDNIWPELVEVLHGYGVHNYSIFRLGLTLFAYLECDDPARLATQGENPVVQRWWRMMEPYMVYNSDHTPKAVTIEEVFHLD